MTPETEGAGGSTPPAPGVAAELATLDPDTGPEWLWEGPSGPVTLKQAHASRLVRVELSQGREVVTLRGQGAKALLTLQSAGDTGISARETDDWCAHLPSAIREVRKALGGMPAVRLVLRPGERSRYRLATPVRLLKVVIR